ncbi:MAG: hypothetical protein IKU65_00275 [Oscillospiraceae bacterium]|nr:hypothetical protein [Oscillospiraceae bacterium]
MSRKFNLLSGLFSYIAEEDKLFSEKIIPQRKADIMLVSAKNIGEGIVPAILEECRRFGFRGVFLDAEGAPGAIDAVSSALFRAGLSVFCPLAFSSLCPDATLVAEGAVSGGDFSEYIETLLSRNQKLALSIPRRFYKFDMASAGISEISAKEKRQLLETYDAEVFYSPQMLTNYFIFSGAESSGSFVLFDDARSVSDKIRLSKKLGVSYIFLMWNEISDIVSDIFF